MKILVTGAAGFIGFHVARHLLDRGDIVVGIDNFNSYYSPALKEDRNAILAAFKGYSCLRADLSDRPAMEEIFRSHRFDAVCHLGAQAGVRWSIDHPFDYIAANITGFLTILEGCRHTHIKKLVYASSSSVYGGNTQLPFSEKDRVDTPINLYAASKKADELMAHCYTHLYGIQTVGLRFFTVYGPWGRPDMAMWLFTEAIIKGKPIQIFNNGKMNRDFTYIDDIVQGVVAAIDSALLDQYEVFNLGNSRSEDLMQLIGIIEQYLGKKAIKQFLPIQPGDVPATYADIEHAQKKLGFNPKTTIFEGVPQFIDWYKNYFKI
jgi:UDP-glucuronate 4-epimerase